jgi:cytochrome c-type biogenesis protein CcmH
MKVILASLIMMVANTTPLADPAEEARAQDLMRELRCVACENEPISQSSAPIAEDMRAKVRELVDGGASDEDVRDWFSSRYGEFVLFRPNASGPDGWLLWGAPFVLLLLGAGIGFGLTRKRGSDVEPVRPEDA